MHFHSKADLHIFRKFWHLFAGAMFVYLYDSVFNQEQMLKFVLAVNACYLIAEFSRFRLPKINQFGVRFFRPVIRGSEVNKMHGGVFFAISSFIVVVVFPQKIAILSVLCLGVGDPIASFFGLTFGSAGPRIFQHKSLVGSISAALACAVACFIMLHIWQLGSVPDRLALSAVAGIVAAVGEALPLPWDDNLTIPILSGISILLIAPAFSLAF